MYQPLTLISVSFLGLYEMACVFKARINPLSNRPCNRKEMAGFLNKVNYTQANVRTKFEPHKRLSNKNVRGAAMTLLYQVVLCMTLLVIVV